MKSKAIIGCLLLVLVNAAWFVFFARTRPASDISVNSVADRVQKEQARKLEAWSGDKTIRFSDPGWERLISDLACHSCIELPKGHKWLADAEVAPDAKTALDATVAELVSAYAADDCAAVIEFMKTHGEAPDPIKVENVRKVLREGSGSFTAEQVAAMADGDVLLNWGRIAGFKSHWKGILGTSGCECFWKASSEPSAELVDALGTGDFSAFGSKMAFAHQFASVRPLSIVLKKHGEVLFVDVKLVVQFDDELFAQPAPYYLRFWYDPEENLWHPFQMVRTAVDTDVAQKSFHLF